IASSRTSASRRLFCVRRCFLHHDAAHRNLHSFPTRRSSDLEDYSDKDGWDSITLASTFGGMAINQAGVAAPHGLEHPASGRRNITHGRGLAALTPAVYARSVAAAPVKFARISSLVGVRSEIDCVKVMHRLLKCIGLETCLSAEGVKAEDVEWITENAFRVSSASIKNHPKVFTKEEVKAIYKEAL